MIVALEMNGINDTRPFLLTWVYKDQDYALYIEKNITRQQLQDGWTLEKRGHKFLVTLEQMEGDDEGNGEHRYWQVSIFDATNSADVITIGSGSVSQSEFFLMD